MKIFPEPSPALPAFLTTLLPAFPHRPYNDLTSPIVRATTSPIVRATASLVRATAPLVRETVSHGESKERKEK
jgi:hypothetical protein